LIEPGLLAADDLSVIKEIQHMRDLQNPLKRAELVDRMAKKENSLPSVIK